VRLLLILLLTLTCNISKAQGKDESAALLSRFESRFTAMDSLLFSSDSHTATYSDSIDIDFVTTERVEAIDRLVDAEISAMKAHTGIDFKGQLYVRPGHNLSYDPDDPLVAYNAKAQAEIEWNIFQSSIYKRQGKIRELQLKGELSQLERERDAIDMTLVLQKNTARHTYYGHLLGLLRQHIANTSLLLNAQTYLLSNGKISSDDLLKLINEKAELERQLTAISADSVTIGLPCSPSATITAIDAKALLNHIHSQHYTIRQMDLKMDLLETRRRNIDYLQTMSIAPFVRFSYYNRENVHNTYNLDVGVSFKVPLTAETSKQRKALQAERELVEYQKGVQIDQLQREIELILREHDGLNESIKGEYERMIQLKNYISMRRNSYKNVAGEYSRIDRLAEYNAYLQSWERLISYQYQRDNKLIDLQSYIVDMPINDFLTFTTISK